MPTRPAKPRDRAKVESAVLQVERWILASLRNRTFFSLEELNRAIREELERLNNRPFQKLEGSRRSLYEQLDRPALQPLPATPYVLAVWKKARVNIDYHIEVEKAFYSVPHSEVRVSEQVDVRLTATTVEILHKGRRLASHPRQYRKGAHSTNPRHLPASHRAHAEWSPSRLIRWGKGSAPIPGTWYE